MRILGIIPARGGSKGIPGKNIKLLGNKPLIAYTFDVVQQSQLLSRTIVSTDDDKIYNTCKNLGMDVPFKRPEELGKDSTPTLSVVRHALDFLETKGEFYDAVCLLQPTTPFRTLGLIDDAIRLFTERKADSLISVRPVPTEFNPHWVFEPDENNFLKIVTGERTIISRRQKLPEAYIRDGALYLTKTSIIKYDDSLYGKHISYIKHKPKHFVNLDTTEDWETAERFIRLKK